MNRIKENCRYFSFYKVGIQQPIKCKTDFFKKNQHQRHDSFWGKSLPHSHRHHHPDFLRPFGRKYTGYSS